jgi:hypothetical protein
MDSLVEPGAAGKFSVAERTVMVLPALSLAIVLLAGSLFLYPAISPGQRILGVIVVSACGLLNLALSGAFILQGLDGNSPIGATFAGLTTVLVTAACTRYVVTNVHGLGPRQRSN